MPLDRGEHLRDRAVQKIAKGTFPKPIRIGTASVRWRASDINEWIAQCAEDQQAPREVQPALSAATQSRRRKKS
ncbi:helix-turn-helix transcriptional regulator [Paraburkholderia translucens]|uniref:helix-turn-helix transcriptional regulator n=1 Tax=Paraburkholderia translucens TaxID=2886945 RepID=UPI003CE44C35